jgi:eukaryotic-like serine/threonine-protein kinase
MIGRMVGNYEIVERLGEGGMGTVWRAVDVMLEREVAVKAIRADLSAEPQIVERFRAEAKILARVHHPAIATIYSFFRDGGDLYLAMELVRGKTLSQVLREEGALPWPRAVALATAILAGLAEVHRTGILHRDLKPDNLMLTEAGAIKVMDFGIARAIGGDRLTRTGLMVGTLRYMSPEQLRGQEIDQRTDLYSLGIVLYEMLTGRVPFPGGSEYEAIRAQVEDPPIPASALVPGLPAWLDRAVLKALAKSPAERFQSAAEMSAGLAEGAGSAAAGASVPLPLPDLPTVRRETPAPAAVPALAPGAPASAIAGAAGSAAGSYRAVGLGRSRGLLAGIAAAVVVLALAVGITWTRRERPADTSPAAPATAPSPTPVNVAPPPPAATLVTQAAQPTEAPAATPPPPEPAPRAKSVVRRTPPAVSPEPQEETAASTRESAAEARPQPAPSPAHDEPIEVPSGAAGPDQGAMAELAQLGEAGGKLADAWSDFRGQKKDRGEALTEIDDKIKDEIDALRDAATRFNRRVNASALRRATWRLRREGEEERRAQVVLRVREIDETLKRIERLLAQEKPGEPVLAVWQEVRRICRRIDELCRGR